MKLGSFTLVLCAILVSSFRGQVPTETVASVRETGNDVVSRWHAAHGALQRLVNQAGKQGLEAVGDLKALLARLEGLKDRLGVTSPPEVPQILFKMQLIEVSHDRLQAVGGKKLSPLGSGEKGTLSLLDDAMVEKLRKENQVLTAPSLLTLAGQVAEVEVRGSGDVLYLARRPDGAYEMRTHQAKDGISIIVKALPSPDGRHLRCEVEGRVTKTVGKTPVEENAETIGLPIMTTRHVETMYTAPDGGIVGLELPAANGEGGRELLLIVQARVLDPKTGGFRDK